MLFLQVILIFCNAMFACSEIAVISMGEPKLKKLSAEGDKRAERILKLTDKPGNFLATIHVAITLCGFLGSAFAAENFANVIVDNLVNNGVVTRGYAIESIIIIFVTIILSYITLIFGDLVPKRIAMRKCESIALSMSFPITFIYKIFAPVVYVLTMSTNIVLKIMGIDHTAESGDLTKEEIIMILEEGLEKGIIANHENEIIQNVFGFNDLTLGDIVTHRREIDVLWMNDSEKEWQETIKKTHHSFYPICDESIDDVVGILEAKDYFRLDENTKETIIKEAVKQPYFVPKALKADILFKNMKEFKNYFAVVLDEYGGFAGIVTINDLIEQLLGNFITGEIGDKKGKIKKVDSYTWKIEGSALIEDIEKSINIKLPEKGASTFNGLVFAVLGKIPKDGSVVELKIDNINIKITKLWNHKIQESIVSLNNNELDDSTES